MNGTGENRNTHERKALKKNHSRKCQLKRITKNAVRKGSNFEMISSKNTKELGAAAIIMDGTQELEESNLLGG